MTRRWALPSGRDQISDLEPCRARQLDKLCSIRIEVRGTAILSSALLYRDMDKQSTVAGIGSIEQVNPCVSDQ
jgi:hypothetical protein